LSIPGGIFGVELENKALTALYLDDRLQQLDLLNRYDYVETTLSL